MKKMSEEQERACRQRRCRTRSEVQDALNEGVPFVTWGSHRWLPADQCPEVDEHLYGGVTLALPYSWKEEGRVSIGHSGDLADKAVFYVVPRHADAENREVCPRHTPDDGWPCSGCLRSLRCLWLGPQAACKEHHVGVAWANLHHS